MSEPIGEIVEVSSTSFVAQCTPPRDARPGLCDPPALGAFVRISPPASTPDPDPFLPRQAIFAIVCNAQTLPLTPGRRPVALGFDNEDDIRLHQPQVFELLSTEFSGMIVAYRGSEGPIRRHIPPRPPRIHGLVHACDDTEVAELTSNVSFFRTVLDPGDAFSGGCASDSLIAACLRRAVEVHTSSPDEFLLSAGRKLLDILGGDYGRLEAIIDAVLD